MTVETTRPSELPTAYDPSQAEERLYRFWEERGYFTPTIDPNKKPFVIIMPPPNVTGELHLGHALTATLEDMMVRWHRMLGDPTLWLPGRDHAGIATQVVVERMLAQEGINRHELGREKFLERVWQWVEKYGAAITEQHKRLGASCDWSRERFTMDAGPAQAVRTTFVNLYQKGLIYRGTRITNWCPRCMTALSDLEVEHEETQGHLWRVRYPLTPVAGETETRYVTVATTRPETILGDTAVAVNPEDPRYQDLVGRSVILPVIGRHIPIVADDAVDPAFGTGAVKITPAHDPVDFEVAARHSLPSVVIMNLDATMNAEAGPYQGMDRFACRRAIVKDLDDQGLMVKVDDYAHAIGHCQRCDTVVEPIISEQWYLNVQPLAERAIAAVHDGRITIVPERFTRTYEHWMENIRDWCISRQLWWGHRIPVWYCRTCSGQTCTLHDPDRCVHCGSAEIEQDPDVLDTWFSSALWPHSTLGWPQDTVDLRYFYPTAVMETGYDILFFWVARMIMMGMENLDEIPFRTVYLHGLIRDDKGDKMSKTRGNVVDPLSVINAYGTDALRFTLSTGSSPGNDMRLMDEKLKGSRNFVNKLWNAARFVLSSLPDDHVYSLEAPSVSALAPEDRWILSRLNRLEVSVNRLLADFQFGEANRQMYDFLWGEYCDWYIELAKVRLRSGISPSPLPVLVHVLDHCLRLLHPAMPFITEELWQGLRTHLDGTPEALIIAPYPQGDSARYDVAAEEELDLVMDAIRAIRNTRVEHNVDAGRWVQAMLYGKANAIEVLERHTPAIKALARVESLALYPDTAARPADAAHIVLPSCEVYLPTAGLVDREAELRRLKRDLEQQLGEIARLEVKLANPDFTGKAPPPVVEKERDRLAEANEHAERLQSRLALLG